MNTEEKDGFTFLATICFDGTTFPLVLLSKGVSERYERSWFGRDHHINNNNATVEEVPNPMLMNDESSQTPFIKTDYSTDHSPKGWTNCRTWKDFLIDLRNNYIPIDNRYSYYDRENRIYLISDSYGSHNCPDSIKFAMSLNIDIITVPRGLTSKYQPLDIGKNGVIKEEQKSFMNQESIQQILSIFDSKKENLQKKFSH